VNRLIISLGVVLHSSPNFRPFMILYGRFVVEGNSVPSDIFRIWVATSTPSKSLALKHVQEAVLWRSPIRSKVPYSIFVYGTSTQPFKSFSFKCWMPSYFIHNPYCFKTITKSTACGWKEPIVTYPLRAEHGGGGLLSLQPSRLAWQKWIWVHYYQKYIESYKKVS
jgi:hypothetical protein